MLLANVSQSALSAILKGLPAVPLPESVPLADHAPVKTNRAMNSINNLCFILFIVLNHIAKLRKKRRIRLSNYKKQLTFYNMAVVFRPESCFLENLKLLRLFVTAIDRLSSQVAM